MKRYLILLLWLFGLLFPLGWLRGHSAGFRRWFDALFGAQWVHIVMHAALFAGLVIILALVFEVALNAKTASLLLLAVLLVGVLQEYFQTASAGRPFGGPEIFDLKIDLWGGLLGLGMLWALERGKSESTITQP
ncbi:MAG: VanZ family protein [Anaerolineae bacterium]|nr:VanZ family protein [Anaerolineae bacterium]